MILPYEANLGRMEFSEGTTGPHTAMAHMATDIVALTMAMAAIIRAIGMVAITPIIATTIGTAVPTPIVDTRIAERE